MIQHECKPAIIAPTYNNAGTLAQILAQLACLDLPVFVVNDGCTDSTAPILAEFCGNDAHRHFTILTHPRNRGKAAAMQTGFAAARDAGFTHAVTIDTDGQLDPEQIPQLVDQARQHPTSLIIGTRADHAADYPSRSRVGRRISNHLVRLQSGLRVSDSQCGLRVYPLGLVHTIKCRAQRFGYETEIITRAGWAGCSVVEVPVNCRYLPPGQRVSHFRPFADSVRAGFMHGRLFTRTLFPWPHQRWPQTSDTWIPSWKSLMKWISLKEAWHQLRHEESGRTMFATGLALGVFIANLPIYGAQTVFSLYASRRLHLHPAPVILGSQISTPPIGIAMIVTAIYVGHILFYGSWPPWPAGGWTVQQVWKLAPALFASWLIGSIIVGIFMAAMTFLVAVLFFRIVIPRQEPAARDSATRQ